MKTILLPFQNDDIAVCALETAHFIANRYNSHIEGLFVLPQPQIIAGEGIALPGVYLTQMAEDGRKLADAAHERFTHYVNSHDIPLKDLRESSVTPSASWQEMEGLESQIIGERGRLFDMVVIGRTTKYYAGDWNIICEAALFESGRLVLIAPQSRPSTVGENVLIVWNCSTECARTVSMSMDILRDAKEITIATTLGALVPGPSGEDMADHLRRHGLKIKTHNIGSDSQAAAGTSALEYAREISADLMIKSAYTHTRLRQMIFGGATREILSNATIPVLMAH